MAENYILRPIGHIRSDFSEKFGIPRQSGLVNDLEAAIVFEPAYRRPDALRGLDGYSHIWLIWQFSQVVERGQDGGNWRPTVRPPRLGGNTRMGVFATRSPFRPNALGLSCVEISRITPDAPDGAMLWVKGADLLDGTPIYDIKPYLPYVDSHPEAAEGFTASTKGYALEVDCPQVLLEKLPPDKRPGLMGVLAGDPRPSYQEDADRVYGMSFAGFSVKFRVAQGCLTVIEIKEEKS